MSIAAIGIGVIIAIIVIAAGRNSAGYIAAVFIRKNIKFK